MNNKAEEKAREYRYSEHHPTGHYTDIQIEEIKEYAYLQGWEDNTETAQLREALRELVNMCNTFGIDEYWLYPEIEEAIKLINNNPDDSK